MIEARAISIGLAVRDLLARARLARTHKPRVHSVFSRAAYIVIDDKLLVSLASTSIRSELSILIDIDPRFPTNDLRMAISPGDPVTLEEGSILVGGGLRINLEGADLYASSNTRDLRCEFPCSFDCVDTLQRYFGIAYILGKLYKEDLEIFGKALLITRSVIDNLSKNISSGAARYYCETMFPFRQLLGLGRGLTPSGDDLVLGLISIYNKLFTKCLGLEPVKLDLGELLKATTEISAYMLSSASAGYMLEPIDRILRLVSMDRVKDMLDPLMDLIYYGHSSGIMIGAGALLALTIYRSVARGNADCAIPDMDVSRWLL